jgi:hypothetical protein
LKKNYCKIRKSKINTISNRHFELPWLYWIAFASSFAENWNFMKHVPSQSSETLAETWRKNENIY